MPRVAYIVSRFPHLPETFILREMNTLRAMGTQVELFPLIVQEQKLIHPDARDWLGKLHSARPFSAKTLRANCRALVRQPADYLAAFFQMIWFNLPSLKFLIRSIYIFPWAVAMADEMKTLGIEHIHAHYATHPALAAWIIQRFTGIPYSVSVHAHDIFVNRTMLKPKIRAAAFVRAISEFNRNYLIQTCGDWAGEKTFVVHCGIQPERYRVRRGKQKNGFDIITVGSLQEYKGQAYLIDACALLRNEGFPFRCTIAGGGELYDPLAKLIEAKGLGGQVTLAGAQTEEQVAELMAGADCCVLPSIITRAGKMEGIPVVLMEALASRLPVIASRISGIPELIEHQRSGLLVPPGDAAAMAASIRWIQAHPQESARLAQNGAQIVTQAFNLGKNTQALNDLFIKHVKNKNMAGEK